MFRFDCGVLTGEHRLVGARWAEGLSERFRAEIFVAVPAADAFEPEDALWLEACLHVERHLPMGLREDAPIHGVVGACEEVFSVPAGALPFWQERFRQLGVIQQAIEKRFNDEVLPFADPDGLRLELVATAEADARTAAPAKDVPAGVAIRGFHSSTLALSDAAATAQVLTKSMGYTLASQSGHRARYAAGAGGPGTYVDLLTDPALPRGLNGAGTIHHVAFRVPDDATEVTARNGLLKDGLHVSPVIDRAYFKSIYYREPAGVLFEIATDGPGFAIDEPLDQLGTKLGLPPHLEPHRAEIEAALPKLS